MVTCSNCHSILADTIAPHVLSLGRPRNLVESAHGCEGCQVLWMAICTFVVNVDAFKDNVQINIGYHHLEANWPLIALIVHISHEWIADSNALALELYRLPGQ
jgi:hypothetical protein